MFFRSYGQPFFFEFFEVVYFVKFLKVFFLKKTVEAASAQPLRSSDKNRFSTTIAVNAASDIAIETASAPMER